METAPHETSESTGTDTATQLPPGQAVGHEPEQRLHRRHRGRMLGGVAAGLADYFDVDPTLVRIGFVALAFVGGLALPLYVAGWVLIPDEDTDTSIAEELVARERTRGAY
jgi:phage shock protein PspC (stress-responsive transcriptional regulator)